MKSQLLDDFRKDQETYRNAIEQYDSQLSEEQKESIQKEQNRIKSKKVKSLLKKVIRITRMSRDVKLKIWILN